MRAAPALQVCVSRFTVWRTALGCVAAVAVLSSLAWAVTQGLTRGWPAAAPVVIVGVLAASASLGLAVRLARVPAFDLRWDGRAWHLGRPAAPATDPLVGDIHVAVDLGAWLLLRFRSEWPPPGVHETPTNRWLGRHREGPRRDWLPVQRRGLEASWHGLRCAVYSPRPAPATDPLHLP